MNLQEEMFQIAAEANALSIDYMAALGNAKRIELPRVGVITLSDAVWTLAISRRYEEE